METNHSAFRKILPSLICAVVVIGLNIWIHLDRTRIIQEHGARSFSTASLICNIATIVVLLVLAVHALLLITKIRKQQQDEAAVREEEQQQTMPQEQTKAGLSLSKPLQEDRIREMLMEASCQGWNQHEQISELVEKLVMQTREMDQSQEKLRTLLSENEATKLYDTNDLLDQVEQYILRNIRKVLNCFQVYDPEMPEDVQKLAEFMTDIAGDNEAQLDNVREFLFAMTDFLNQQGDNSAGIQRLNIFKETILESIKEEEAKNANPFHS